MKKIGSHIGTLFLHLMALLPLRVLYLKANFLYFVTYYLIGYRKKVVFSNLQNSFPEKSKEEIKQIAKKFYHHLGDIMVESVKLKTMSIKTLKERMVVKNPELVNRYFDQGKSVIVLTMHYNNWEWQSILQQYLKHQCLMVYNPARNLIFDAYINNMRKRFGSKLVSTKKILKTVLKSQRKNEPTLTWLCADQRPKANTRFWTTFLNQDAGFFPGPENLARHTNQVVLYQHIEKKSRGKYETHFEVLCENPKKVAADDILKSYVKKIDSIIKDKPEFYLWSHKRWKHKNPNQTTT
ncbi:lysophospholipid acyltransferase family protein [Sunxiuqinia sp. A32]|uniref:lysophospholipid acyltransferase family protein n=1 Tax=Sunxiuqinia sp. A32 TaxID=3461496 RepID=UPI0040467BC2